MSPDRKVPVSVKVVGWLFTIAGAFCIGMSVMFIAGLGFWFRPPDVNVGRYMAWFVTNPMIILIVLPAAVGAFIVFTSRRLLRGEPWSRAVFEILCCLQLLNGLGLVFLPWVWVAVARGDVEMQEVLVASTAGLLWSVAMVILFLVLRGPVRRYTG